MLDSVAFLLGQTEQQSETFTIREEHDKQLNEHEVWRGRTLPKRLLVLEPLHVLCLLHRLHDLCTDAIDVGRPWLKGVWLGARDALFRDRGFAGGAAVLAQLESTEHIWVVSYADYTMATRWYLQNELLFQYQSAYITPFMCLFLSTNWLEHHLPVQTL